MLKIFDHCLNIASQSILIRFKSFACYGHHILNLNATLSNFSISKNKRTYVNMSEFVIKLWKSCKTHSWSSDVNDFINNHQAKTILLPNPPQMYNEPLLMKQVKRQRLLWSTTELPHELITPYFCQNSHKSLETSGNFREMSYLRCLDPTWQGQGWWTASKNGLFRPTKWTLVQNIVSASTPNFTKLKEGCWSSRAATYTLHTHSVPPGRRVAAHSGFLQSEFFKKIDAGRRGGSAGRDFQWRARVFHDATAPQQQLPASCQGSETWKQNSLEFALVKEGRRGWVYGWTQRRVTCQSGAKRNMSLCTSILNIYIGQDAESQWNEFVFFVRRGGVA